MAGGFSTGSLNSFSYAKNVLIPSRAVHFNCLPHDLIEKSSHH